MRIRIFSIYVVFVMCMLFQFIGTLTAEVVGFDYISKLEQVVAGKEEKLEINKVEDISEIGPIIAMQILKDYKEKIIVREKVLEFSKILKNIEKGKYNRALKDLNSLMNDSEQYSGIYLCFAYVYIKKNDLGKAVFNLNTAVMLDGSSLVTYWIRTFVHGKANNIKLAIADLSYIIKNDPKNVTAYALKAKNLYLDKEYLKTLLLCNQTLELDPSCFEMRKYRGKIYYLDSQYEKALLDFNQYLEQEDDLEIYLYRARTYVKKKMFKEAQDDYNRILELDSLNVLAYVGCAEICIEKGDLVKAEELVNRALQLNPNDLDVVYVKANIDNLNGNVDSALKYYDMVLLKDKTCFGAYLKKAEIIEGKGDLKNAVQLYRKYIQNNPLESSTKIKEVKIKIQSIMDK